jgi:phosphoglycerate dehydrogenase-like enzyme
MDDAVQLVDASALKSELRELRTVEAAIGRENLVSEFTHNLIEDGLARLHLLASACVGFDDISAKRAQVGGDSRFAATESSGESYSKHASKGLGQN